MGCNLWGCKELYMIEHTQAHAHARAHTHTHTHTHNRNSICQDLNAGCCKTLPSSPSQSSCPWSSPADFHTIPMGWDPSGPPQRQLTQCWGSRMSTRALILPPGETVGSGRFSYPPNTICLSVCGAGGILLPHAYVLKFSKWYIVHK